MGRVDPLPPADWPPTMQDALAALRPANPRHAFPPRDPSRPKGLNVLGLLAHHPELTTAYHTLVGHILYATTLTAPQRELLVLRVAHLRDAEYEWAQHVVLARDAGLTDEEIERVRAGSGADGWSPLQAALLDAADELVRDARVSPDTWSTLRDALDTQQLLDVVFTVGTYDTLAMAFRTFELELDDDLVVAAGRKRPSP